MQAHAIVGSGVTSHLDLVVGGLPLRLCSEDSALLSSATRRYHGFIATEPERFPIKIDRYSSPGSCESAFACDFDGARAVADVASARFTGVRHEFALDSLLRMLLTWALLPGEGFLLHAATVTRDGKAYVFFGRSGAGKSTVASLSPAGSVLTDEISLLKRVDGEWRAVGTPFWGEFRTDGANRSAPVAGIYRLLQSPRDNIATLGPADLLKALLPCVLFFSTRVGDHDRLLEILTSVSREVAGYTLQFRKARTFWEVLPS
jgi:hypothetical protein